MRRLLLLSVAAALVLSGCGGSSDSGTPSGGGDLADVTVSAGDKPTVKVPEGFSVGKTEDRVLTEGTGDAVASGDAVKVNYVAVNGRNGKQFDSSFTTGEPYTVTLKDGSILPGFIKGLVGQKIGTRVLVAMPPADGFGQAQSQLDIKKDDTLVFMFDVVSKVPTEATGAAKKLPSDVPDIVFDADKQPDGFAKDAKAAKNPTAAASYTAIQGDGAEITADQTITINYVGQVYPDGEVFDSSWRNGAPLTSPLSSLISCWKTELVGKKLGSRVVLVCPKDTAYAGSDNELKDDTLIFAVDLLDAS